MARAKATKPAPMTAAERTELINRPFPPIGAAQRVQAYPWSGTIVGDNWFVGFGPDAVAERNSERVNADVDEYVELTLDEGL